MKAHAIRGWRTTRSLRLTESGRALRARALGLLAEYDALVTEIGTPSNVPSGRAASPLSQRGT